ncbi:biopolymer transporter ExbD [Alloprevotella sp. OH1205_COT-284]|uniref:ExbD/TolR family protein n=1 Tax=Alloprevotella sp. OH1205_COT-284 TaxID=2491043 RepID=UPI000F5F1104|nr:biopolymer transporter ExbD [Alloprevotella sp. OH1205_COT-284]RRD78492.1 biopolymer transporter ExbD [Alloprevotella sp. OH1205_COT-284]
MAQIDTGGGDQGKSKQKKMNARVDFTPMVDMIMLLVTFFMLCTTLLKPQTMEIVMPSDKEDIKKENKSQVQTDEAITIIIDKDNKIYYFEGKPSEATLQETSYGKDGIRAVLLNKNKQAKAEVDKLKKEFEGKYSANAEKDKKNKAEFKERLSKIKNADGTPTAIIKPTDASTYKNLIDILDEMANCYIGKYVIDKVNEQDKAMVAGLAK